MTDPSPRGRGLLDASARAPVVLDAAVGTRLIAHGLRLDRDDPCLWNLSAPEAVADLHARDAAAGALAVLTNTFGANRAWLARFDRSGDAQTINLRAVELARAAAGPERFVVGAIGPTASDDPSACRAQAEALAGAGVDALVFETFTFDQASRVLADLGRLSGLPLIVSLVAWPEPARDAARRLEDLGVDALGANCQNGVEAALRVIEALAPWTGLPLWVKPSAGLPGDPPDEPERFAAAVPALLACGARFLGGCCGTTEAHVAAIHAACYHFATAR
jgi:methionine synthase I (cobalamin-dependent)